MQASQLIKCPVYANWKWLSLTIFIIALDQLTKWLAVAYLSYQQPVHLVPLLNLTLAFNPGAAFSFLSRSGGWQRWFFTGFSFGVSIIILVWLLRTKVHERWLACGLSLILGGALGNLIDRLLHGYVIDFIDVYYGQWHWPTFNIADSAITIGAFLLLLNIFFGRNNRA